MCFIRHLSCNQKQNIRLSSYYQFFITKAESEKPIINRVGIEYNNKNYGSNWYNSKKWPLVGGFR
ncbi:MAG: hypothetical protein ACI93P_001789 [bacterium]|jgi:hypothetical protein